jgi:hypothetical protein
MSIMWIGCYHINWRSYKCFGLLMFKWLYVNDHWWYNLLFRYLMNNDLYLSRQISVI